MSKTCLCRCVCIHFSPRGRKNEDSRNSLLIFLGIHWWIEVIIPFLLLTRQAIVLRRSGIWEQWVWWLLLGLVVPFRAGLPWSHQPFLPSYTVINLELHRGGTWLSWFCLLLPIFLPSVLQCFSLLCIIGLLALILLLIKLSTSSQPFFRDEVTATVPVELYCHSPGTEKQWHKSQDPKIWPSEVFWVQPTNTISLLPWWQKFS